MKDTTLFEEVFLAFATYRGVPDDKLRLSLDGKRPYSWDTPKTLEMEDGDVMRVYYEQCGCKNNSCAGSSHCLMSSCHILTATLVENVSLYPFHVTI